MLSVLINRSAGEGIMKDLHIFRRTPGVSHLLFADDTYLQGVTTTGRGGEGGAVNRKHMLKAQDIE